MANRQLTTEQFIEKARAVHGDKYDYSKTVYTGQKNDVIIICPIHGEFRQRPNNHYSGAGCPRCSNNHKKTTEEFIEAAKAIHGDTYDYSNVVYKNSKEKVKIVCPLHGMFLQTPDKHLLGEGCPFCSNAKLEQTNLKRYGVRRPLQSAEIHKRAELTSLRKYGVANPLMSDEVKAKRMATSRERFGTDFSLQNSDIRNKIKQTNLERYGSESPFGSDEIQAKARQTIVSRYGVKNVMQSDEIKVKVRETNNKKYGTDYGFQSDSVREKIKQTNIERYGAASPLGSDIIREKSEKTNLNRYGTSNPMQSDEIKKKVNISKLENDTFLRSFPEDNLYNLLVIRFGKENVKRQYMSDDYPYACDFYIVSRDMYIELNVHWSHGYHWYGDDEKDSVTVAEWSAKDTEYYKESLNVWTVKDTEKRKRAAEKKLNYLVFWDEDLRDATVWFLFDTPDGHDYDVMYSWFEPRDIGEHVYDKKPTLTDSHVSYSNVAKAFQFDIFYKAEKQMWHDNKTYKGLPLQIYMYYNRYLYTKKYPEQLTDLMLMRGFTISGVRKGFTVFDTTLMDMTVKAYDIKNVYDPCAGWGERMLYCYHHGLKYTGVDINAELKDGYAKMIKAYGIEKQRIVFADSSSYVASGLFNAVITCPPYYNTEIYSENGAESLEYDDFLTWWDNVIKNCVTIGIRYFCFQINRRYRDDMCKRLADNGYIFRQQFDYPYARSSHLTRRSHLNLKRETESMLVFEYDVDRIDNIRALRLYTGLSQDDFADRFGFSASTLRSWEQGRRNMTDCYFQMAKKLVKTGNY